MKSKKEEPVEDPNNIINKNELRIAGMSRSGNHSIINWILQQLQGRFCFLNCAEPKTNPFGTARPLFQDKTYKVNYPDFDFSAERKGNFSKKDYLIYSYEDCFLSMLNKSIFEQEHDLWVGPSRRRMDILILRDPFNLFASRKKSGLFKREKEKKNKPVTPLTALRIWKQHAREAIGEKSYLPHQRIYINYNSWASDYQYRKKVAKSLNLNFNDNGIHEVSKVAGGSSFDGVRYATNANNMKVLERWKHYINDPDYLKLFDEETIDLSNQLFNHIPDKRLFPV